MRVKSKVTAEPGDVVVVHGNSTGDPERTGVILEVLGNACARALSRSLGRGARIALLAGLGRDGPAGSPPQAPFAEDLIAAWE